MTLRMVMLATFLLCFSTPSLAFDWQSLWLNNDQRGKKALEQESYQQAAEQFKQAEWQAYSHYKNGEFEQAASLFSADNAVSAYNKGNALAQLGDLEGAISVYQQALEMQPDFADAKANKALLEQLLEQQQQEQENQDGGADEQQQQSSDEQQQNSEQESQQDDEQQEGGSSQSDDLDKDGEQSAEQQEQENSEQQEAQNAEQERSENQEAEQNNVEQQDAQGTDTEESEKGEQEAALQQVKESELSPEELEQQRQLEQWFRAVEDNPGELLKNKFRYQYEQNRRRQQHLDRESDQVW